MGLTNLSFQDGFDSLEQRLTAPIRRYFAPALNMKEGLERNDFKAGLELLEYQNGSPLNKDKILLIGQSMPHQPFGHGGTQKIVKDFYPGNSEPSIQVLGSRENDIVLKGRFKSKKMRGGDFTGQNDFSERREEIRRFAQEMQELVEAMRLRGNLVRMRMGEFQRYGFIEEAKFMMKTLADIDYEIRFSVVGFNKPRHCKIIGGTRKIPVQINKTLIAQVNAFQEATQTRIPDDFPKSFSDQLNDLVSDIAGAVNLLTNFVDEVLNEVDSIKASIDRAIGLAKNAKSTCSTFQRRVGAFDPLAQVNLSAGAGIGAGYTNANYLQESLSGVFSITALLASLQVQLAAIAENEPLARHRVQDEDTLQRLAQKYYNDQSQWSEIYDHNQLDGTELEVGAIIEIPRID